MTQPPNGNQISFEERDDGYVFKLRNEVEMHVKWHSPKHIQIQMWRQTTLLPPDIGNPYNSNFRKDLVETAQGAFGKDNVPHIAEDIDMVASALATPTGKGGTLHEALEEKSGPSVAERLVLYARKAGRFWHTPDREPFATVRVGDHVENYAIESRQFRDWMRNEFWRTEKARLDAAAADAKDALANSAPEKTIPEVVRAQSLTDAVSQIAAMANFDSPEHEISVRTAAVDGKLYIDLCDETWRVVEISTEGWRILAGTQTPVKFIRPRGMAPLPEPTPPGTGTMEPLRKLLNLQGDEGERSWRLILAWLVQALRSGGKEYPILVLLGERGSAKSTTARIVRALVDPSTVPLRHPPKNPHDLFIDANSSWVISLDNISSLPRWLSNTLCQVSTGGGFSTRTLYTNRDQELFEALRPVILNGITEVVVEDDIVHRSLIVRMPVIGKGEYKTQREISEELEVFRSAIFSKLLDALVEGLRLAPSTKVKAMPRMGDFAAWAVATETALGGTPGSFEEALGISDQEGAQEALEASPLTEPLYDLAAQYSSSGWEGTATELLAKLNEKVEESVRYSKEWPQTPTALGSRLVRIGALMRDRGEVSIEKLTRSDKKGSKRWRVALISPGETEDDDAGEEVF
jgi:hypothetical protein